MGLQSFLVTQAIYVVRIFLAGVCGLLIGRERQMRIKAAGVKTHFIIAMASSLMVIVSKYGFYDALAMEGASVDVARVAAGVLTGVGLIGGGLVFSGKQGFASGLTTAAGLWATIAIGMSFGAGMYLVGLISTAILLAAQAIFHKNFKWNRGFWHGQIDFLTEGGKSDFDRIIARLEEAGISVLRVKCEFQGKQCGRMKVIFAVSVEKDRSEVIEMLTTMPNVYSYEF